MTDFQIITLKGLVAHLILFTDQVLVDDNWFTEICVALLTAIVIKLSKFITHHTSEEVSDKLRKIVFSPFHLLEKKKFLYCIDHPQKTQQYSLNKRMLLFFWLIGGGWYWTASHLGCLASHWNGHGCKHYFWVYWGMKFSYKSPFSSVSLTEVKNME